MYHSGNQKAASIRRPLWARRVKLSYGRKSKSLVSTDLVSLEQLLNKLFPAFTRTLTIIYSTTLLTLLTTMQLNIIGRSKYIQSVMQLHREEKLREYHAFQVSTFAMFFPGFVEPEKDFDQWLNSDLQEIDLITPETERKFLTLSWWLLYVGWKDMGERVRRSVEEVFEG